MPQAVTHVLITIILLSLFRDSFFKGKSKSKSPLHYVLIGGIAGLLPDIDVAAYYILSFFGFTIQQIHRTFSHNLFVVAIFVLLGILAYSFRAIRIKELGRHHLKFYAIFYVIAFGVFVHLLLDALIAGSIMPFYPASFSSISFNLIRFFPAAWQNSIIPSLDAVFLVLWLVYMEIKHKISDFI